MTEKKYPEKIYPKLGLRTDAFGCLTYRTASNSDFESAYDLGFEHGQQAQGDPLAGWSNLTEAIKAGERIDWEALDGLEAKCVHPELGALTHKMERDPQCPPDGWAGWGTQETELNHWDTIFECAWGGWYWAHCTHPTCYWGHRAETLLNAQAALSHHQAEAHR